MNKERDIKENAQQMNLLARQSLFPLEVDACFENRALLRGLAKSGRAKDMFINPPAYKAPLIIVGSGPSLDEAGPHLHKWKGDVSCSTSQAKTLIYYGKPPKYIVAYDVRTEWDELKGIDWKKYPDVGLCVHPGMSTDIINRWIETGNPIYLYRQRLTGDPFREEVLPIAYSFIRSSVMMGGCTLAAQLTMMMPMGYTHGFLFGVDFSASRFTSYELKADKEGEKWIPNPPPAVDMSKAVESVTGVLTDTMQTFYKRQLFVIMRMDRSTLISCSTPGKSAINELPWAQAEEVIERQGQGYESLLMSREVVERVCDVYLAQAGKYCIDIQGAPYWLEKVDPMKEIPEKLAEFASKGARVGNIDAIMEYWKSVMHEAETGEGPLQKVREAWAGQKKSEQSEPNP